MFLTVVISTRNRSALLDKALGSLTNQTYPQATFEVIVVDNGSSDTTRNICLSRSKQIENFRYLYDKRPGLYVARHAGWQAAQGEIIIFTDDDVRVSNMWLEGIYEAFQDRRVGLVGGKILPEFESTPPEWLHFLWRKTPWGMALPYYSLLDFGDVVQEISPLFVWGCNFAIREHILREVGGFHPDSMPDNLLCFRGDGETSVATSVGNKGYAILYHPKALVYHLVSTNRMSEDYLYRRAFAEGISASYTTTRLSRGISFRLRLRNLKLRLVYPVRRCLDIFTSKHTSITDAIRRGFWAGYWYHQKELHANRTLVEWVLKKNYLQENGCEP